MTHDCTRHPPGSATCYAHHACRCEPCRREHAKAHKAWALKALQGRRETIDATGTVRRIQALCAAGWSRRDLAAILGMEKSAVDRLANGVTVCWRSTAARVRAAFETHWQGPPEPATPHQRACRARTVATAARQGWALPMAWDDIDDPAATPWESPAGRLDVAAEVEMLIDFDTPLSIAARLGYSGMDGLYAALRKAGRDDLKRRLVRQREAEGEAMRTIIGSPFRRAA